MTIKVNMDDAHKFARDLDRMGGSVAKRASARALTQTAKVAKNLARKKVKRGFQLRNKWTIGSIKSTRAAPRAIRDQFALAGSQREYMRDQELGSSLAKGQRVTTARGSNEGDKAFPRRRRARGAVRPGRMKIQSIKVRGSHRGKGRRAYAQVIVARRKRIKLVYLDWGKGSKAAGGKGFFKVIQNEIDEKPMVRMVHGLLQRRAIIKRRRWLEPSTDKARALAPRIWGRAILKAVDEAGLFR